MSTRNLIANYSRAPRVVRPAFVTFPELTTAIYARIRETVPTFLITPSIEKRIHDLWMLGAPHPQTWSRRLLLPTQMQKLAHELGQEVGAQVMKSQGQHA